ncbi:hypothetical protein EDC02_7401 [Micromonospora sp. Llam0]|nr:hypothetical protein EDC02_7401 [Micromonospora sp. Llam0]
MKMHGGWRSDNGPAARAGWVPARPAGSASAGCGAAVLLVPVVCYVTEVTATADLVRLPS